MLSPGYNDHLWHTSSNDDSRRHFPLSTPRTGSHQRCRASRPNPGAAGRAPYTVERGWDYGKISERFICWTVLEHPPSNTAIAYCEQGFGPSNPWGLVFLTGEQMGIGMDSGWFSTLESAMRDSMAWDGVNPENYEVP